MAWPSRSCTTFGGRPKPPSHARRRAGRLRLIMLAKFSSFPAIRSHLVQFLDRLALAVLSGHRQARGDANEIATSTPAESKALFDLGNAGKGGRIDRCRTRPPPSGDYGLLAYPASAPTLPPTARCYGPTRVARAQLRVRCDVIAKRLHNLARAAGCVLDSMTGLAATGLLLSAEDQSAGPEAGHPGLSDFSRPSRDSCKPTHHGPTRKAPDFALLHWLRTG